MYVSSVDGVARRTDALVADSTAGGGDAPAAVVVDVATLATAAIGILELLAESIER